MSSLDDMVGDLSNSLGEFKEDFGDEVEKFAKKIKVCMEKILTGSDKEKKDYLDNLNHLKAQLKMKRGFASAKAKKAGYNIVKSILKAVINTAIGALG